jgi:hypothetical protein
VRHRLVWRTVPAVVGVRLSFSSNRSGILVALYQWSLSGMVYRGVAVSSTPPHTSPELAEPERDQDLVADTPVPIVSLAHAHWLAEIPIALAFNHCTYFLRRGGRHMV